MEHQRGFGNRWLPSPKNYTLTRFRALVRGTGNMLNSKANEKPVCSMSSKSRAILNSLLIIAWIAVAPAAPAQLPAGETARQMAAAHASFMKNDTNRSATHIHSAAAAVKKDSEKVAESSKAAMKKAGEELDKLGDGVKNGAVKSEAELKKTFAKVENQVAGCWHKTAAESKKAGRDASENLKKAGASLSDAAKWSGHKLSEGANSSVEAIKKAGQATGKGVKTGADEVDNWFKNLGDGISDLGRKLSASLRRRMK